MNEPQTKTCSTCRESKPVESFYLRRNRQGGRARQGNCKACSKAKHKRWRDENKKHLSNYSSQWYKDNQDARLVRGSRRRGMVSRAKGKFTKQQWQARLEYHGHQCRYCRRTGPMQIEHMIPLSRGGANFPSNLVPACKGCNTKKGTRTYFEFMELINES